MWQNRQSLYEILPREEAENVQSHLPGPAKRSFAIAEQLAIDEGVGKLIIKGHTEEGAGYAWFNFVRIPRHVALQDIGNLNTDNAEEQSSTNGFMGSVLVGMGFGLGRMASTAVFPPAAPYFAAGFMASWTSAMKHGPVDHIRRELRSGPRILGPPVNLAN
ncbi:hypothetical protein BDV26DRAFT_291493 [Aspergillus bertholletiae]|uniref:Uncharacterized protein n=1 Tax=Aspergillus bertholletiae TaxID=1226010 RepID=A0A5N7BBN4_9EURO|nr:hypothetical protein BDV26DRAFT_291493 [Aspergillus bertholletiae]